MNLMTTISKILGKKKVVKKKPTVKKKVIGVGHFMSDLTNLQSRIMKNIHDLNCGGCGIFALMFYEEVTKLYPKLDVKICVYDRDKLIVKKNTLKVIKKNNGNCPSGIYAGNLSCSHIAIRIGDYHFDGYQSWGHEDRLTKFSYPFKGYYTHEELKYALRYGSWNNWYETRQNSFLKKLIKSHLVKYKNYKIV